MRLGGGPCIFTSRGGGGGEFSTKLKNLAVFF